MFQPICKALPAVVLSVGLAASFARDAVAQTPPQDDFAAQRSLFNYDSNRPLGVIEKGAESGSGSVYRRRTT